MVERYDFLKEEIRQRVSVSQVVERYTDKKIDSRGYCNCPLHHEKTASFKADDKKGVYYCFGCGKGGDIYRFLQDYLGIGFKDAVMQIDKDFTLGLTEQKISVKAQIEARERKKQRALEVQEQEKKNALHAELCLKHRIYHNLLKVLEPMTYTWGQAVSRQAFLEYELDKITEGLR